MKMLFATWFSSWLLVTAWSPALAAFADAGVASEEIQDEIDALRQEIDDLRDRRDSQIVGTERLDEIRALVADVVSDAGNRTSFQDTDILNYKQGFVLASPDNGFRLELTGQIQARWVLNRANGAEPTYLKGFEIRRARVDMRGHVVDPSWTYRIRTNFFFLNDGIANIDECWIAKSFGSGWMLKVGQFKTPWLREQLVPDSRLLAVERSVVSLYFDQLRSQGMELSWQGESDRIAVWTGDGLPSPAFGAAQADGFNTTWNETNVWYSFAARGEHRLAGDWEQFTDLNSPRGADFAAMVGVAGVIQRSRESNIGVNDAMTAGVTADLTLCFSGASLFLSGVWLNDSLPNGPSTNPWGVVVQGGVFLTEHVQVFGRYEYMEFDPSNEPNQAGRYNGPTIGANWFFNPAVRLTMDWSINLSSLPSGAAVRRVAGMRSDQPGESDQWSLRAQIQLLF